MMPLSKNTLLALLAGLLLIIAVGLLAGALGYRAGYRNAVRDIEARRALQGDTVAESGPTPVPTATIAAQSDAAAVAEAQVELSPTPPRTLPTAVPISVNQQQVNPPQFAPEPTAGPSATPTLEPLGEVQASIDAPTYLNEGRWAEVMLNVTNVSVSSGISTGYTYVTPNPGGGTQYVTIFDVVHEEVPQAILDYDAPLWIGHVTFSDGTQYQFPAGCFYVETIDAEGWEPIGPAEGFTWKVHWTGGFFDCGNSTHKIPQIPRIMPGQSATIPLYVYIMHPRLWEDEKWSTPRRRIEHIGMEIRDGMGRSLGIVAEYVGQ